MTVSESKLRSWLDGLADGRSSPLYSEGLRIAFLERCCALFESPQLLVDLGEERLRGALINVSTSLAILIREYRLDAYSLERTVHAAADGLSRMAESLPFDSTVGGDFWADVVRVRWSAYLGERQRQILEVALTRLSDASDARIRESARRGLDELLSANAADR